MSLIRSYDSRDTKYHQPRSYDVTEPSYHGYSDDYWSMRSEGYSSAYSSHLSDRSEENPFSSNSYSEKNAGYSVRNGRVGLKGPFIGTKYPEYSGYEAIYRKKDLEEPHSGTKYPEDSRYGAFYREKDIEESNSGTKHTEDSRCGAIYREMDLEEPNSGTKYLEDIRYETNNNWDANYGTEYADEEVGSKDHEVMKYMIKSHEVTKYVTRKEGDEVYGAKSQEDTPYGTKRDEVSMYGTKYEDIAPYGSKPTEDTRYGIQYDEDVDHNQHNEPMRATREDTTTDHDVMDSKYGTSNRDYRVMNGGLYNGPGETRGAGDERGIEDLMDRLTSKDHPEQDHVTGLANAEEPIIEEQSVSDEVFAQPEVIDAVKASETIKGPVVKHKEGFTKFVSVIPEENRYITTVNYLPDRIELRLSGVVPMNKPTQWRSIPDLYNITLKPLPQVEEKIDSQERSLEYAFDDREGILDYRPPKHDHLKEMYVTQYTHHFDPDEPRSHIAGWKVDIEPNGIPHEKSRMCVLRSPVVSGSWRRPSRPKSAPPKLYRFDSFDEVCATQRVDVAESLYSFPRGADDDDYSVGYAPSDDTSDSSAFVNGPGSPRRRRHEPRFGFSKPRLIRLSADFPGVRNLEKMRRKRQSMGSVSSEGDFSTSSLPRGYPSTSTSSLPRGFPSTSTSSLPRGFPSTSSLPSPSSPHDDYGLSFAMTSPPGDQGRYRTYSNH